MLRNQSKSLILLATLIFSFPIYAAQIISNEILSLDSVFTNANSLAEDPSIGTKNMLLAFDIDNTLLAPPECKNSLTTECRDLGSTQWWDWQSQLLNQSPDSPYLVAHDMAGLIQINNIIMPLMHMNKTEENIDTQIKIEQNAGIHMIALTSRDVYLFPATESQLLKNNINLRESAFGSKQGIAGNFIPEGFTRPLIYNDGIMMTTGQDKGKSLQVLLSKYKTDRPKIIIFVDDVQQNIENVASAFENDSTVQTVYTYYYRKEQQRVNEFNSSVWAKEFAKKQWHEIKNVLSYSFGS